MHKVFCTRYYLRILACLSLRYFTFASSPRHPVHVDVVVLLLLQLFLSHLNECGLANASFRDVSAPALAVGQAEGVRTKGNAPARTRPVPGHQTRCVQYGLTGKKRLLRARPEIPLSHQP